MNSPWIDILQWARRNIRALILWSVFAVGILFFLSLIVGSFQELEPRAGWMFGGLGLAYLIIGGLICLALTRDKKEAREK